MRFLHTADWHLGRLFHARSLIEDQSHVLDQFVALVRDLRPDAVLIAGDVYDRAVPPPEAVALLDDVLARIVVDAGVPVVMIAGNHDSAQRLGFGARLLAARGLHVAGRTGPETSCVTLHDAHGEVRIYALPYAEPAAVRDALGTDLPTHEAALNAQLDAVRATHPAGVRSVAVAHAFVVGGAVSESERPLSVGGSGAVAADVFHGFDFVALGHLHRPQSIGARIHYSGSLLKYSLSETEHIKTVSLIDVDAEGGVRIEAIPLRPLRELRVLTGTLAGLLEAGATDPHRDDYVHAVLTDAGALLDPMARLRQVYPNALAIERAVLARSGQAGEAGRKLRELDTASLFANFFREVADTDLDDDQRRALDDLLAVMQASERESA
ncbi:exonuclease SbcCD subunit D [Cupriavidus metallidurans]|uniref:Nuclease SbcCD subunit D n=1 Tax=Cupriavidus metallidurans (strain ATCC 43123 / DSM 2839 / NBRC 102507 / CH34) TaxID=266264 RepID=Q1LH41_CUPMC|nr:exonuclease SbcCD subunit D [Cupriavidus metallidurans]ABF10535.1 exonuclease dsDNA SbcCD, ATP-dependent, D subunit [Cupriavidus metallidurans CH34]QGS31983.1 exonuclease subunit SbcD [Cupriavidus metallidurans]